MSGQYPSDLTDGQWQVLRGLLPRRRRRGRRPICRRLILNAILYLNRTGCQWRSLPHDFPNWKTVYTIFWRWRREGVWRKVHEALCRRVRQQSGKKPTPSVAIVDSQSIRTAEGGAERGYDAGKKITGRKRHVAVDTLGLVWAVVVHGAYWQDHDGACLVPVRRPERGAPAGGCVNRGVRGGATGTPSGWFAPRTSSRSGSTGAPGVAGFPLMRTAPAAISSSALRRDAMPASARNLLMQIAISDRFMRSVGTTFEAASYSSPLP